MEHDTLPPSMIARLLEEISWEKAVKYRRGGRGMENVLTAEVLIALTEIELARGGAGSDSTLQ